MSSLNKGLFIRVDQRLLNAIDALVKKNRKRQPGRSVSRSDVVREILYSALFD